MVSFEDRRGEMITDVVVGDAFTVFRCPNFTLLCCVVEAVMLVKYVEHVEEVEEAAADGTGDGEEQDNLVSCLPEDQLDRAPGDEVEQTSDSAKGSHGRFGK